VISAASAMQLRTRFQILVLQFCRIAVFLSCRMQLRLPWGLAKAPISAAFCSTHVALENSEQHSEGLYGQASERPGDIEMADDFL